MRLSINPGRLFWKLVLALFLSMVLAGVGVWAYVSLTGHPLPPPPEGTPRDPTPLIPIVAALLGSLAAGLVLAWYLSRPLRHLRWALDRVAHGRLDTRVQPFMRGRRDEIADLAHDFDRMAEQLQKAVASRRVLLHDVSHELRSPLARMQTAIGLLRQDTALTEPMLARIELESERLDHLIEELLTLHRLEDGAPATPRERVDLIELLHAITEDADFEARAKGNQVRIGDSVWIRHCIEPDPEGHEEWVLATRSMWHYRFRDPLRLMEEADENEAIREEPGVLTTVLVSLEAQP